MTTTPSSTTERPALLSSFSRAKREGLMPLCHDPAAFQRKLADLPVTKYRAGDDVLTAGSNTGKLLFLKSGAVEVTKDGVRIARVSTPGAVFGELAALLDQSHTADVRTIEPSEFL